MKITIPEPEIKRLLVARLAQERPDLTFGDVTLYARRERQAWFGGAQDGRIDAEFQAEIEVETKGEQHGR
jgi:hypothetical protein